MSANTTQLEALDIISEKLPTLQQGIRDGQLNDEGEQAAIEISRLLRLIQREANPLYEDLEENLPL